MYTVDAAGTEKSLLFIALFQRGRTLRGNYGTSEKRVSTNGSLYHGFQTWLIVTFLFFGRSERGMVWD
jgi:hypothetical protein